MAAKATKSHVNVAKIEAVKASYAQAAKVRKTKECPIILLDSGSDHHLFNESSILKDIMEVAGQLTTKTNGGKIITKKKGVFPGVGRVWFNPGAIINILSLDSLNRTGRYNITYHGDESPSYFSVEMKHNGLALRFVSSGGIYVHVLPSKKSDKTKTGVTKYSYASVETVENNKKAYTQRQLDRADRVLGLIQATNYASEHDLIAMLNANAIANCPITADDVRRFFKIYKGVEGAIKGKTRRKTPAETNVEKNTTDIPRSIKEENRHVILCADIFFIQGAPFFTTISRNLMYTTATALRNRKEPTIYKATKSVIGFYATYEYHVKRIFSDNEFGKIKEK